MQNTDQQTIARRESAQNDNIVIEDLMQSHDVLLSSFRSRLTKLQVTFSWWLFVIEASGYAFQNSVACRLRRKFEDLSVWYLWYRKSVCHFVMLEASDKYSLLTSQVVHHFWERNDIRGAINALRKLPDHSVSIHWNFFVVTSSQILYLTNTLTCFLNLYPVAGTSWCC